MSTYYNGYLCIRHFNGEKTYNAYIYHNGHRRLTRKKHTCARDSASYGIRLAARVSRFIKQREESAPTICNPNSGELGEKDPE